MNKRKKQIKRPPSSVQPRQRPQSANTLPKPQLFDQMAAPIPRTVTNKSLGVQDMMDSRVLQQAADNVRKKPVREPPRKQARVSRADARRRRNRRRLAAVLIAVAVIAIGLTLSVTVLFKIDSFTLEGDSPYAVEELALAFAHPVGENIFGFIAKDAQNAVSKALPYIDTIEIRRRLPGTIVFKVTQSFETYYISTDSGFVVLSAKLKILRISQDAPTDLVSIVGAVPSIPVAGEALVLDSADKLAALNNLLAAIAAEGLDKIGSIDITSELEMSMLYDGRAKIIIGTQNGLEDKLAVAKTVMENHIGQAEQGTLDVSHQNENEHRNGVWRAGKL